MTYYKFATMFKSFWRMQPAAKLPVCYRKSPFSLSKSFSLNGPFSERFSMAISNSQRVYPHYPNRFIAPVPERWSAPSPGAELQPPHPQWNQSKSWYDWMGKLWKNDIKWEELAYNIYIYICTDNIYIYSLYSHAYIYTYNGITST